jgi:predicted aldo/keto reductase-like oxidoreductase
VLAALPSEAEQVLKSLRPDATPASWAIRYAASLPNVMTVLSGMNGIEQVRDNIKTLSPFRPLSNDEREALERAATLFRASGVVPCTGCRYCMDCPSGVDIPRLFSVYNNYRIVLTNAPQRAAIVFDNTYHTLPESVHADHCIACGACRELCPQKIDIPERVKEIADLAAKLGAA